MRTKLVKAREGRVHPGWDDKVLADWNGLMIAALARAAQVFDRPGLARRRRARLRLRRDVDDARRPPAPRVSQGSRRSSRHRRDYANMIWAALRLYQATARDTYLDRRPPLDRGPRPPLLGGRRRRLCHDRRRHRGRDRPPALSVRRRHPECQRHHGLEPRGALAC